MTRVKIGRLLVLVLLALQPACSLLRRGENEETFEPAPITVTVENRSWNQVAVYVVAGGQRQRLGEVIATSAGEFVLPGMFTTRTDVRLVAAPLAVRQQYATGVILVNPGDTIHLVVANVLNMSSYSVR